MFHYFYYICACYFLFFMKNFQLLIVLLLSLCALSACHRSAGTPNELLCIDSTMNENPHFALKELEKLTSKYKDASQSVRMKLALLKIKAADKSFIPQESDSTMLALVDYYDEYGTANERMEAYYYLGCAYRDLHDSPKTLKCYRKAIDLADTADVNIDWELYSIIMGQLAGLYDRQYKYDDAIAMQERVVQINARKGLDNLYAICTLGMLYSNQGSIKQAAYWFNKGLAIIKERDIDERYLQFLGTFIAFYSRNNYKEQAEQCYALINALPMQKWPVNTLSAMGTYYEYTGKTDSALYYTSYADGLYGYDIYRRLGSVRSLYRIHRKMGNEREALRYAQLYMTYSDSVEHDRALEQTSQAEGMYQYYKNKKQQMKQERETYRNYMFGTLALVALLLLALAFIIISRRRRKRLMKAVAENNSLLQEKIRLQSEVSDSRQRLGSIIAEHRHEKLLLSQMAVDFSEIVGTFRQKAKAGEKMTDAGAWDSLFATINHQYPDFKEKISGTYGELNLRQTRLLYLLRAGLNKSTAATLLGIHRSSLQYWCRVLDELAGGVKVEDVIARSGIGEERMEN